MSNDVFTYDDLYDHETIQEASQIGVALSDVVDSGERTEIAILIALGVLFHSICEQADIDAETAFSQIAEGADNDQFEPAITGYIHAGPIFTN